MQAVTSDPHADPDIPHDDARRRPLLQGGAALPLAVTGVLMLATLSLFVGVSDVTPLSLLRADADPQALQIFLLSRVPRTVSIVLAGAAMAICGLVMQMLVRNRFVEPSTIGTTEAAGLGLLAVTILAPGMPLFGKMLVAAVFALASTLVFVRILRGLPLRSIVLVPLVGLMLSGVIASISTYVAFDFDLLQTLSAWMTGDFSGVIAGRYELIWSVAALTVAIYIAGDRFTVAGLGEEFTTNLGLNYRRTVALGLFLVSIVTAVVVVVVGALPFLGLVVPNIVSLVMGDNLRQSLPWVAVVGAAFVLVCDVVGRVIRFPYEIPIGVVVGVVGAALFLALLLRKSARVG
ncbi:ABC transporter permease [Cryobacterium melibiosiphilum]|uniref:ABC transporter permease n=1 Tax=Cryobacterium melibiosiphilum TaxID=995039 RepID=A0A3A5MSI7_9MICO|nr:iron chelate uptake ABC transporter family permease subunit [Cryobacterium melibiosiphilum]RJT88936.1 ABC transporter permease [Cryobacterium melibiosiphilum]